MNYKSEFYEKYFSTHVLHRKGQPSLDQFNQRAVYYQRVWGRFFPGDKNARIIDIGCGTGSLIWWLQQSGFTSAEGIDISPEQIEIARGFGITNIEQAELKTFLATKATEYDVVILRDVLEHFTKEDIVKALEVCHAALRRGGIIILQVPNAETPFFGRIRYGDFTHEIAFSASSLQQLLHVMGFGEVRVYSTPPIVTGPRSLLRFLLWRGVEVLYRVLLFAETGRLNSVVTESIIAVARRRDRPQE